MPVTNPIEALGAIIDLRAAGMSDTDELRNALWAALEYLGETRPEKNTREHPLVLKSRMIPA